MPTLSWRHHTLIQAVLSRGPLKEKEFQTIFSDVTGKSLDSHKQVFNEYLGKINMELAYVQFELRACRNQYDGCVYYGVINTVADEQSKLGTKYSVPQIAFYKGIIEAIVQDTAGRGTISNIEALNIRLENQTGSSEIPTAYKNFSFAQKEKAIQEFIQDQWLCATSDGNIGLGVRSFLDLRSWFHNNEVPPCNVCNEAGIKADLCPNDSCNVRIHNYCLKAKFSQARNKKVCPGCGTQWPYVITKAEAVEEEQADTAVHSQFPEPSRRKRSRVERQAQKDNLTGQSQSQRSTQAGQASRQAKPEPATSDEVIDVAPGPSTRRATRTSARYR